jgi:hypothetical protein
MTAGGKREGAGRKPKFKTEEETTTISFRVPLSKVDEIRAKVEKILKAYTKKKK